MAQKMISMTEKELIKYDVIKRLINGDINGTDASKQLTLCTRQIRRLKTEVIKFGAKGLIHGNRGKNSNRKIKPKIINKIVKILKEDKYSGFGPTLAQEKLKEDYHLKLGRETLRLLMIKEKLWRLKSRRQSKLKHLWRPRKDNYGEMQQFDGSYHYWLEDRFGELCLLASIDDATGKITYAKFDYNEGVNAVFKFWLEYFKINNMPISIYLDKFSTYKINHKNAVDNKEMITQFQRATSQIGIKLITAHSPEAKGRVERLFQTLQDRLVKEMRLAGISTLKDANEFLKSYIPKFNKKFSVLPVKKTNLHKEVKADLESIFSIQSKRKVHNDYTIMFKNNYYQLEKEQPTTIYKKDEVMVEEHLNEEVKIKFKGYYLKYFVLPERPKKQLNVNLPALTEKEQSHWKPPIDHPWRKFSFGKKLKTKKVFYLNN